jgi:uncharacterized membrane protein
LIDRLSARESVAGESIAQDGAEHREELRTEYAHQDEKATGGIGGAVVGAALGAVVGGPVGAVVGGLVGAAAGEVAGSADEQRTGGDQRTANGPDRANP